MVRFFYFTLHRAKIEEVKVDFFIYAVKRSVKIDAKSISKFLCAFVQKVVANKTYSWPNGSKAKKAKLKNQASESTLFHRKRSWFKTRSLRVLILCSQFTIEHRINKASIVIPVLLFLQECRHHKTSH